MAAATTTAQSRIPWLVVAHREMGVKRIGAGAPGDPYKQKGDADHHVKSNPRIMEYFKATTTFNINEIDENQSWCSAFVNWCMARSGITGTRSAKAKSWLSWGVKSTTPMIGAVAVFERGGGAHGHVGMVWDISADGFLSLIGGNQAGDGAHPSSVCITTNRKANSAIAYLWPTSVPIANASGKNTA